MTQGVANIIQRPFGHVADTNVSPKQFIYLFLMKSFIPDYSSLYLDQIKYIEFGLNMSKLTDGEIHLNHNAEL